jgi:hypothetical protein
MLRALCARNMSALNEKCISGMLPKASPPRLYSKLETGNHLGIADARKWQTRYQFHVKKCQKVDRRALACQNVDGLR